MSNGQTASNPAGGTTGSGRGAPQEVHAFIDQIANCFDVPAGVRQHFVNSRIEFLKGVRAAIDHRIEKLSAKAEHGSKIAVE
jgi:hypothetical protein